MTGDQIFALILLFILLCTAFAVFMLSKIFHKPKRKALSQKEYDSLNVLAIKFNGCLDSYNLIVSEISIKIEDLRKQAINAQNSIALEEIRFISDEYHSLMDRLPTLFQDAHRMFDQTNVCKLRDLMDQIDSMLLDLSNLNQRLSAIKPMRKAKEENKAGEQSSFFHGCSTKEELDRRYRLLAKAFHPDSGCGDSQLFEQMTKEYESRCASF